ncbi:MAG: T9SS type A sorting domain-containing protein [Lewinellaceae bacterium]|nr:T9SS type A sorting domain-containing protein [Lewinellaceae bacterium]
MEKFISTAIGLLMLIPLMAQPSIEWQKTYGGSYYEHVNTIQQTSDGGYILSGTSTSNDGDVSESQGNYDFWIVKLNETGAIEWEKSFGGSESEVAVSVAETNEGGFIVSGYTNSPDGDVTGLHGYSDVWVVKLSQLGELEWERALGGTYYEGGGHIKQTTDGGYIVMASTGSVNGDVSGNHGSNDFWVIKLSETGMIEWQKAFGGTQSEYGYSIEQTIEGGYVMVGSTRSNDGDVLANHGKADVWVVKLSETGTIEWQQTYGGTDFEAAYYIQQTNDGGYVVAGSSSSFNGDIPKNQGGDDVWILKLSATGEIEWSKTFGGTKDEEAFCVQQTSEGGYIVAAYTYSNDGDIINPRGDADAWVLKLASSGEIEWQMNLGGTKGDGGYFILEIGQSEYVLVGKTSSNDGDVSGNHGEDDYWVVKINAPSVGLDEIPSTQPLSIFPNPATHIVNLRAPNNELVLSATISNLLGQQFVQQAIPNGSKIDISTLPKGFYVIKARTDSGKSFSSEFVKQE